MSMSIEQVQLTEQQWLNFFRYYNGSPWQDEALKLLREHIMQADPTLLTQTAEWVDGYRSPTRKEPEAEPTKLSDKGLALIKEFEGLRLQAYYCASGVLTIGYGSTGAHVYAGMEINEEQAENMLRQDVGRFEDAVCNMVKVPLTQGEFDALVSFTFNCGEGALQSSTMLSRLNRGDDKPGVFKHELKKWVNGPAGPLPGLVRRRDAEIVLALS